MWSYQVELPARTVAHLMLGMTIGAIIVIKVAIVRFFKHLEGTLVPFLGTALLICTTLLIGLSTGAHREVASRAPTVSSGCASSSRARVCPSRRPSKRSRPRSRS